MPERDCEVLIIGAGMAGLAAAVELRRAGVELIVLEARARIGGRIRTHHEPLTGVPIELGAEFVHGKPPELLKLVHGAGLRVRQSAGEEMCLSQGRIEACDGGMEGALDLLDDLAPPPGGDCTFEEYLDALKVCGEARSRLTRYVEGFNAADRRRIGVRGLALQQQAENEIDGATIQRVETGYDGVPMALWREVKDAVRLSTEVHEVRWRRGRVEAHARHRGGVDLAPLTARRCVITVPVGVLQAGTPRFVPAPADALEAARRIAMGAVVRISLLFSEWPSEKLAKMGFLHAEGEAFPTWWTRAPSPVPLLTAWSGGPAAERHAGRSSAEIARTAVESLARMLGRDASTLAARLQSWHVHDWQSDPLSRGAYSYIPAGAFEAPAYLARPVQETLWFSGEATDVEGHWGTVHGALATGRRAAREILERRHG